MLRIALGLAAVVSLSLTFPASADAPKITGTVPLGVPKGVATDVTIQGTNLGNNPRLIAPFEFQVDPNPAAKNDAASWTFKLTAKPGTPLGTYPIRVWTNDGLSNPFLFTVGQLPQVAEKEDNSTFETAQVIPTPAVIEGQAAGNDVDYFKFAGKKGQTIVIDAQCARIGSGVDPSIRLTTADRRFVASADDTLGLITDARLTATLPDDTDYVIELSDSSYQGGGRPVYRLLVGSIPVADEVFPIGGREGETVGFELRGGSLGGLRVGAVTLSATADSDVTRLRLTNAMVGGPVGDPSLEIESLPPLEVSPYPEVRETIDPRSPIVRAAAPVVFNGRIDPAGDEDRFNLAVTPGQVLMIEVMAAENGSALDGVLQVLGPNQAVLGTADDTTIAELGGRKGKGAGLVSPDPSLAFTVPAGVTEITLALKDLENRGGTAYPYRISVEPVKPTFELLLNEPEATVPRKGSALVGVTVRRLNGYAGPIQLSVANPPAGLTFRPGTIAAGQNVGVLSLSSAADAAFPLSKLDVVGKGPGTPEIVVSAIKHVAFAKQGELPTNTLTQLGLPAVPADPEVVGFEIPSTPIEVVHGYGANIPVKLQRQAGADAALAVTTLPLPPGLTVPAANLAEKVAEGNVPANAAVELPLGPMTIGLVAKGKFANFDKTFHLPAVTLDIVRPAAIELAAPALELKAGATFELKGKVVRKAPFAEPVTVKVQGLPAGLKADPVTLPPDKADFVVPVIADPKAAPAMAGANVSLAFQVQKKDYALPAVPLAVKVLPAQ
ncbi:hypothetical protein [Singulisphaera sp. PoT]|uniref:hypothetical protein n=1 Tax=Singulisphaera sp. PoT TaxID=3411797 RepID=UPI003BF59D66